MCTASLCQPVVIFKGSYSAAVSEIAVDANNVYWTGNGVMQLSLGGGTPLTLASGATQGIAVDATSVYWTDSGINTKIGKVAIGGGTVTTLASVTGKPSELAVDSTSVYWTNFATRTVSKVPKSGGTVTLLASSATDLPYGIAVDASNVYVSTSSGAKSIPISGGTTTVLSTDPGVGGATIDAMSMYWVYDQSGVSNVYKVPLGGGTTTTLATGMYGAVSLAVDGLNLYVGGSGIWRMPTAGGTLAQVVKFPVTMTTTVTSIQTDAAYIYFAAYDPYFSYVMRVAK
jgi:hypothetical protein